MKKTTNPKRPDRPAYRQLVTGCTLSAMLFEQNAAAFTVSDVPLFLPKPMEPNVVLTIDDSSSMNAAYAPETINCALTQAAFFDRCPPESVVSVDPKAFRCPPLWSCIKIHSSWSAR